jgi:chromosome segregation ATPase
MSAFSSIKVLLSMDKAQFSATAKDALKDVNSLQRGLSKIGLRALGPLAIVAGSWRAVSSSIERSTENLADMNTKQEQAARNAMTVSGAMTQIKNATAGAGDLLTSVFAKALATTTDLGAGITSMFMGKGFSYGIEGAKSYRENTLQAAINVEREKAAREEMARIEAERSKVMTALKSAQEQAEKFHRSQLSDERQLQIVYREQTKLRNELARASLTENQRIEIRTEITKKALEAAQIEARIRKGTIAMNKQAQEAEQKAIEVIAKLRSDLDASRKLAAFEELDLNEKIADIQREIIMLERDANEETESGLQNLIKIEDLQRDLKTLTNARAEGEERVQQIYERQLKTIEQLKASMEKTRASGLDFFRQQAEFRLEDLQEGRTGTRSGQRSARAIAAEEERRQRLFTRRARSLERGDTEGANQFAEQIRQSIARDLDLRGGIIGLRGADANPLQSVSDSLKSQLEELKLQTQILQEL